MWSKLNQTTYLDGFGEPSRRSNLRFDHDSRTKISSGCSKTTDQPPPRLRSSSPPVFSLTCATSRSPAHLPFEALQSPSPPYVRHSQLELESRFFARPFRLTSCLHPGSSLKMMGVSAASPSSFCLPHARSHLGPSRFTSLPVLIPASKKRPGFCRASKQQQQTGAAKKKAGRRKAPERPPVDDGGTLVDVVPGPQNRRSHSSPLPKPPAGFVLDDHGRVLLASKKRIVTIVRRRTLLPSFIFYFVTCALWSVLRFYCCKNCAYSLTENPWSFRLD